MGSTDEHVRRWREAGLIDADLEARITAFEAERAEAEPTGPGLVEVLIYLGVAVIGAGVMALIGPAWDEIGVAGRIAVPGAAGLAALTAGFLLRRMGGGAVARQAQVAWLAANALLPIAGGIAAYEAGASDFDAALGGAAAALAIAVVFWLVTRGPIQLFALAAAPVPLAFAVGARSDEVPLAIAGGLIFAAGAAGVALAERRVIGPLQLGRALAALLLLGGAYFAGLDERDSAFEAIVHVAAVALIVLGLRTGSFLQLALAVIAIFVGLNTTICRHMDDPRLAAVALIGLGFALIMGLIAIQLTCVERRRRAPLQARPPERYSPGMPPRPFQIAVPDEVLDDLRERLARTRWPDAIPDTGWDYGADLAYVQELCEYWRNEYDWRRHEAAINARPQFLAEVDGVDIHFWHVRGEGPDPHPLLLTHGWPGSMFEFLELTGPLTDPSAHGGDSADAFDVVIPSIPGFGWSGKPRERGWGPARVAAAFDQLMTQELGYGRYGAQGGDWGSIISSRLGSAHTEHLSGVHLNFTFGAPPADPSDSDREAMAARQAFQARETGYSSVQGTKPQSLGIAQTDSPAGIAAWIVEKFRTWSDCGGDVESRFSKDTLLTNIMFYWAPNSIASAARIYYEARNDGVFGGGRVEAPTGIAYFPGEPWNSPRHWVEPGYNVQRWTDMPSGGHFAALEEPEALTEDIRAFFRLVR